MCWSGLDAAILVERATEIEYRDGQFYVTDMFGDCPLRRCYTPHVFLASLLKAELAMAAWQAEQSNAPSNVAQLYPVEKLAG